MSTQNHHAQAERLAQKGHPDDEIREYLNKLAVEPYQIEVIIQDLANKYPNRRRKRPQNWTEIIAYFGGGFVLLYMTLVLAAGSGYLFFIPMALGFFLFLMGIGKLWGRRE